MMIKVKKYSVWCDIIANQEKMREKSTVVIVF